jgi:glycosyltransferase involved in cell wall biosynthesis
MAVMAPTIVVKDDLEKYGLNNVVLWSRGVDLDIFKMQESKTLNTAHPIFLYVGRVAIEKNINAFLEIDLPGSKWVVGDGPAMAGIKEKEQDGYGGQYNYFFPDDLIRINTDKHFRYGGAGDIDWEYFNEILSDRLNY